MNESNAGSLFAKRLQTTIDGIIAKNKPKKAYPTFFVPLFFNGANKAPKNDPSEENGIKKLTFKVS